MAKTKKSAGPTWQLNTIQREKKSIKRQVDVIDADKRVAWSLAKINELSESSKPLDRLRCFIHIVSILLFHSRFGGLSELQVRRLGEMGDAVLRTQRIKTRLSKLSFLYADLQMVLGFCYRRRGDHWLALWSQQLSYHVARGDLSGGPGHQVMSSGLRALRLGNFRVGLRELEEGELVGLHPEFFARSRLERVKSLRLQAKFDEAAALAKQTIPHVKERHFREEFEWESLCRRAIQANDVSELVAEIRKGDRFTDFDYALETFLWTRAVNTTKWVNQFKSVERMMAFHRRERDRTRPLYPFARALENLYDYKIPLFFRLQELGKLIPRVRKTPIVEGELLILAAAARWLARSKSYYLATLLLDEYRWLCLRLSDGECEDVLNLVQDLKSKAWYKQSVATKFKDAA